MKTGNWAENGKLAPTFGNGLKETRTDLLNLQFATNDHCLLCVSDAPVLSPLGRTPRWAPHPYISPPNPHVSRTRPHPESSGRGPNPKGPSCPRSSPRRRAGGRRDPADSRANLSIQCVSPPFPTFPGRSWHGSGRSRRPAGPAEMLMLLKVAPSCEVPGPPSDWDVTSSCLPTSLPTQFLIYGLHTLRLILFSERINRLDREYKRMKLTTIKLCKKTKPRRELSRVISSSLFFSPWEFLLK